MNPPEIIVFEDSRWVQWLPLVYSRAVFQLVCGTGTLLNQVQRLASRVANAARSESHSGEVGIWCRDTISMVAAKETGAPTNRSPISSMLLLNSRGRWHELPSITNQASWIGVAGAQREIACICADNELAQRLTPHVLLDEAELNLLVAGLPRRDVSELVTLFDGPWELVLANEQALVADWESDARHRRHLRGTVANGAHLLNPDSIHIGKSTRIKPCVVIDAENGPVWIGDNVTILPHSYVEGPAFIGDGCLLQPGAVVHAGSTIGPRCKVGGEIESSIIHGFSNKQHDGFLGHSYIGSWVNIAADCINSDLKNTYGTVRVPINGYDVDTGELFVGMIVGDHSKSGINVSFPTGAVIGFGSSVFCARSPKFVPSFAWVDDSSFERYEPQRAIAVAERVMARRDKVMCTAERELFLCVFQEAQKRELQSAFGDR